MLSANLRSMNIDAIVFDMDGVIVDTEDMWNSVRRDYSVRHGGHWTREEDQPRVMGANSMQWAASMRENNGVDLSAEEIYRGVVDSLKERFAKELPIITGVPEAIARMASVYSLGVASASPLEFIEYALELSGVRGHFTVVLSADEVGKGKPEPDVYLEACSRLGVAPVRAVAVEDSSNGIKAAHLAGMSVIAVPNPHFPPSAEALVLADTTLSSSAELTEEVVEALGKRGGK